MFEIVAGVSVVVWFGLAASVLSTIAYLPYIADTLAGRTQPQRASWLIWSVLGSIAFFSQVYEGAGSSLGFAAAQVAGTITVLILSVWRGQGTYLRRIDFAALAGASVGLALWFYTENAAYALSITIGISLLGGLLTASKAYRAPESETLSTWVISLVASVCAMLAVGSYDLVLLAYPAYLFTLYTLFVSAIILGRVKRPVIASA